MIAVTRSDGGVTPSPSTYQLSSPRELNAGSFVAGALGRFGLGSGSPQPTIETASASSSATMTVRLRMARDPNMKPHARAVVVSQLHEAESLGVPGRVGARICRWLRWCDG